jgi:hypothetical protein
MLISWTASATANVKYVVLRASCGYAGPFVVISNLSDDTTFVDYTVTPGVYYYIVRTVNQGSTPYMTGEYRDTAHVMGQFSGPRPLNDDVDASGTATTKAAVTVLAAGRTQGMSEAERILRLKGQALLC